MENLRNIQPELELEEPYEAPQPEEQPAEEPVQHYSLLREYFVTTVVCTIFALFVTTYIVHPMTVPTPSMEPTILVGDRLFIDKFTIRNSFEAGLPFAAHRDIERGDILVFKFPKQPEVLYVKRAVGLPGEVLEIRDKVVHINGNPLSETYTIHSDPYSYPKRNQYRLFDTDFRRDNFGPVRIPEDSYFMMGDNRDDSADSRYFGFLPRRYILGKPLFIFWSYEDDANAYKRSSLPELLELYLERVIYFFPRTRWSRMGRPVQ